jgi:excisionase family DNA binding protein
MGKDTGGLLSSRLARINQGSEARSGMAKHQTNQGGTERRYNRPVEEAKRLGISRRQLSNWMRDRTIPFIQRGRVILFDPQAVDEALERFENREGGRA